MNANQQPIEKQPPAKPKAIVSSVTWSKSRKRSNAQYASDGESAEVTMLVPEGVTVAQAIEDAKALVDLMLGPEPTPARPAPQPQPAPPPRAPPTSSGGWGGSGASRGGFSRGPPRPKPCKYNCGVEILWDQDAQAFVEETGAPHQCPNFRRGGR